MYYVYNGTFLSPAIYPILSKRKVYFKFNLNSVFTFRSHEGWLTLGCIKFCIQADRQTRSGVLLPLSPKVNGGCVFTPGCLSVCEHNISKSYGWIWTKLGGQVGCGTKANRFDFGGDLICIFNFLSDSSLLRDEAKTICRYSVISQTVMDGFRRN